MTKIEKVVKIVSDLYDFYRKIPKVSASCPMKEEKKSDGASRKGLSPDSGRNPQ